MLDDRQHEIDRLNNLLIGGRPVAALARDCCYRGVDALHGDVDILRKEKYDIQEKLRENINEKHEAMQRAMKLEDDNRKLKDEFNELKRIALSVESEANLNEKGSSHQCMVLKEKLNTSRLRIRELETMVDGLKRTLDEKHKYKDLLKQSNEEKKYLQDRINNLLLSEKELRNQIEKMKRLNLNKFDQEKVAGPTIVIDDSEITPKCNCDIEIKRLQSEKDYYENEYIKSLDRTFTLKELESLRKKLDLKNLEVESLKSELNAKQTAKSLTATAIPSIDGGPLSSRSVQSMVFRIERERDSYRRDFEQLNNEYECLKNQIQKINETKKIEIEKYEKELQELLSQMSDLENENRKLIASEMPHRFQSNYLKEENQELNEKLQAAQKEILQLKTTNNQMQLLCDQTEQGFMNQQTRLNLAETKLQRAESRLSTVDSNREQAYQELGHLKGEIVLMRSAVTAAEKEKDKLLDDLNKKTDKVFALESELKFIKLSNQEFKAKIDVLQRSLSENKEIIDNLSDGAAEATALRLNIKQMQQKYESALAENGRLTEQLTDIASDKLNVMKKLKEAEQEVQKLKDQLHQYVQKVKEAEDLLLSKEEERDLMLDNFRTISHDAIALEGANHNLEQEATQAKRNLADVEAKTEELMKQLTERDSDHDRKMLELTNQINDLECQLESSRHCKERLKKDLEAVRLLCNKLDNERDKLNAELNECSDIRRKLERDNDILRNKLTMSKTGDLATVESLKELLTDSRKEIDQYRVSSQQSLDEIKCLRNLIDELRTKMTEEHATAVRNEALVNEYRNQIKDLRRRLATYRFDCGHLKETTDRYTSL